MKIFEKQQRSQLPPENAELGQGMVEYLGLFLVVAAVGVLLFPQINWVVTSFNTVLSDGANSILADGGGGGGDPTASATPAPTTGAYGYGSPSPSETPAPTSAMTSAPMPSPTPAPTSAMTSAPMPSPTPAPTSAWTSAYVESPTPSPTSPMTSYGASIFVNDGTRVAMQVQQSIYEVAHQQNA